jgi:hypothetical protein
MSRRKKPREFRVGERVRVRSDWSRDIGGMDGTIETVSAWDVMVRMDKRTPNGLLLSFPRAALEHI